jgi:S1-C subfamily serine protease
LVLCLAATTVSATERPEQSVVRIVNYSQRGEWYTPWSVTGVGQSSGSGFVIDGGLVMTNAHVVSDSRLLLIVPHNGSEPHVAQVVHVAHDCDLALIRPEDPAVLESIPPLPFGEMPELGSRVDTLGFPVGGSQVSSTRGVVSRIEEQLYVHSGMDIHVTVQTDAAINPGNSGGPVIQEGEVVGVAFQANPDLQSVGFFIPLEVVGRFLEDVADGNYDGYPELGTQTAGLQNPAPRAFAGMKEDETGVRVHDVFTASSASGLIEVGDVILSIEGRAVANDGTVEDGEQRIPFGMLVDRKQIGESVTVGLLRAGERMAVDVPLTDFPIGETHGHVYDALPRYFIYSGLVFVPLDREVMKTFGRDWRSRGEKEMLYEFFIRPQFEPDLTGQERVVLLRRLDQPVNVDMAWYRNQVVEKVNGRRITGLADLIETLENHEGEHHLIEFSNLRRIGVLDRQAADAAHAGILERYGITEDRRP